MPDGKNLKISQEIRNDSTLIEKESKILLDKMLPIVKNLPTNPDGTITQAGIKRLNEATSKYFGVWERKMFDQSADAMNKTLDRGIKYYSEQLKKAGFKVPHPDTLEDFAQETIQHRNTVRTGGKTLTERIRGVKNKTADRIKTRAVGRKDMVEQVVRRNIYNRDTAVVPGGVNSRQMKRLVQNENFEANRELGMKIYNQVGVEYVRWVLSEHLKHCQTCIDIASGSSELEKAVGNTPKVGKVPSRKLGSLDKLSDRPEDKQLPPATVTKGRKLTPEEKSELDYWAKKYGYNGRGRIDFNRVTRDKGYQMNYRLQTWRRGVEDGIASVTGKQSCNLQSFYMTVEDFVAAEKSSTKKALVMEIDELIKTGGRTDQQIIKAAESKRLAKVKNAKYAATQERIDTMRKNFLKEEKIYLTTNNMNTHNGDIAEKMLAKITGSETIAGVNNSFDLIELKKSGGKVTDVHLIESKLVTLPDALERKQAVQTGGMKTWYYKWYKQAHAAEVFGLPSSNVHGHQVYGVWMGKSGIVFFDGTGHHKGMKDHLKLQKGKAPKSDKKYGTKPNVPKPKMAKGEVTSWYDVPKGSVPLVAVSSELKGEVPVALNRDFYNKADFKVSKVRVGKRKAYQKFLEAEGAE